MQSINRAACRRSRRELAKHPQWGTLEEFARGRIQSWLQDLLEEESTDLLGRGKSERRALVHAPAGYPQRPWQNATLIHDGRHHRSEATASAGSGAAFRE